MAKHIYVHIPYCEAKCPYCSFFSVTDKSREEMLFDSMERDVRSYEGFIDENDDTRDSVYFGGGTPSFASPSLICGLLFEIRRVFEIGEDAEITIEVNPNSLTEDLAARYRRAGFNRISVGVQSLHDDVLRTLGRLHNGEGAEEALKICGRAGFTNISADLIIGVPGQRREDAVRDADVLISLGVKHISMYSLSIEEGTEFEKRYGDDPESYFPEETEREMYHGLRTHLKEKGIFPYEISNCAYKGYESVHNSSYWRGCDYVGIGPGAVGFLKGKRIRGVEDIGRYIASPTDKITDEVVGEEDRVKEYAMLMLRMTEGIDRAEFKRKFKRDPDEVFGEAIKANLLRGLIESDERGIRLTSKGTDLANIVSEDFL
ncbi:MAG TPA: coproporphyrinogen III oxidase [Clostridiales bacterium]|nr:coproporphyrinogen III oxidase [Clostridiales bacterium]